MRRRINEKRLNNIIAESIKSVLNEGAYGYPDTVDSILVCSENDRECYDIYAEIVRMLVKKHKNGVKLSREQLANSSVMKKYQQFCFRKFKSEQEDLDSRISPSAFRNYVANRMIDDIEDGLYND